MKSSELKLIKYNDINKVFIRRMYKWTYVINTTYYHLIKGKDIKYGLA
jgi:hypothetical protein